MQHHVQWRGVLLYPPFYETCAYLTALVIEDRQIDVDKPVYGHFLWQAEDGVQAVGSPRLVCIRSSVAADLDSIGGVRGRDEGRCWSLKVRCLLSEGEEGLEENEIREGEHGSVMRLAGLLDRLDSGFALVEAI